MIALHANIRQPLRRGGSIVGDASVNQGTVFVCFIFQVSSDVCQLPIYEKCILQCRSARKVTEVIADAVHIELS